MPQNKSPRALPAGRQVSAAEIMALYNATK